MAYDPRAVANLLLDKADHDRLEISNLALQKLLYFAHAHFLIQTDSPLVHGAFEAWTYGPVHPAVYQAFKGSENRPIRVRARGRNVMTGEALPLATPSDPDAHRCIRRFLAAYGDLSAGRLIDISHASNGPWDTIVKAARSSVVLGMRISDDVTRKHFKYLKVSIGNTARVGDPYEDTPLTGN